MLSMRRVGLDVRARRRQLCFRTLFSGELRVQRIAGRPERVLVWLETLEQPFRAVYEAGPTGYGLARRAAERGLDVVVGAPGHVRKHPVTGSRPIGVMPSGWLGCWPRPS